MTRISKGFSIVEVVIIVAVIGLIGLIGYRVWDANQDKTTDTNTTTQNEVPEVKTEADLDKADAALDAQNIEGNEAQELESEANF